MFTFIGILMLVIAVGGAIISRIKTINLFKNWKRIYSVGIATLGIVLMMLPQIFFYADTGTAYAVQYPNGAKEGVFTQGLHMKWFGRVIPIQFEIPIKYVEKNNMKELKTSSEEGQYIHVFEAKQWEFNDAVKANISTSVVISINTVNIDNFLKLADRNKSEENLVNARILPNINQAIKNTCKLMSAQDYISGKAADFDRWFKDQLENGMYILERVEIKEEPDVIGSDSTIRTVKNVDNTSSSQQVQYEIKRKPNGEPYREGGNSLSSYGLTVIQAVVDEINWERAFDERLTLQKNEVAQTQLEKQQAEKEFYRAQKEIAKGEAEKAKEQARLEKEQIQKTIAAETKVEVAKKQLQEEKTLYEVAQYQAKTKKVAADAQAYENMRLVRAGLTPQEEMAMEIEIADKVSKNIAGPDGLNLPQYYINGGGKGDGSKDDMMMMILLEMMKGNKNK